MYRNRLRFGELGGGGNADLGDGRQIQGTYLGGSAREVQIDVGDRIESVSIDGIARSRAPAL